MLIFSLLLISLFFAIYKRRKQLTIFKRLRILGPRPNFIFGHLIDVRREGLNKLFPKWVKKYGPIVGFYLGGRPQLLIADPELIRRVLVKDFRKFNERNQCIPGGVHASPELQKMLIWRKYNDWKYMRGSLTGSFSPVKLTAMKSLMMASIDKLLIDLHDVAKGGKEFNIKPYIYEFTFSTACKCTFGLDFSLKQLTEEAKNFVKVSVPRLDRSILAIMMILFPSLTFILYPLRVLWERFRFYMSWSPEGFCYAFIKNIVQSRKDSEIKSVDFLQLLINTKRIRTNNDIDLEMSVNDVKSNNSVVKESHGENISEDETVANTLLLLIASYEGITNTLQYCVHNLMHHQIIQEELRTELRNAVSNSTAVYDVPMLNYVIKETLRMFPVGALFVTRVAAEDYEYNDIIIPKGMPIHIGISSIHNDTTLWPNPEKFQPKRFQNGYDKMSYLSFGVGPKNCIGMRFAYMELQMALAKLILNYRFEPGPSTRKKMETTETFATLLPKYDIICKITKVEK